PSKDRNQFNHEVLHLRRIRFLGYIPLSFAIDHHESAVRPSPRQCVPDRVSLGTHSSGGSPSIEVVPEDNLGPVAKDCMVHRNEHLTLAADELNFCFCRFDEFCDEVIADLFGVCLPLVVSHVQTQRASSCPFIKFVNFLVCSLGAKDCRRTFLTRFHPLSYNRRKARKVLFWGSWFCATNSQKKEQRG